MKLNSIVSPDLKLLLEGIDELDVAISVFDRDLKLTTANRRFCEILDFPASLGQPGTALAACFRYNAARGEYGPGDADEQVRQRIELARQSLPHRYEHIRPDGTVLSVCGTPLKRGGMVTVYTDITAQKQREQALTELSEELERRVAQRTAEAEAREAELNRAQAIAKIGSWALDVTGNECRASAEAYRIFGLPEGAPFSIEVSLKGVHQDDRGAVQQAWLAALDGAGYDLEFRIVDGEEIRWVRSQAELAFAADGTLQGCMGTVQDITEHKQVEQILRVAASAFEAQEGMIITDANKVILRVNRAFTDITGYSAEEAVGQTPRLLSSGRHNAAFYTAMWESIEQHGSWQGEIWDRRKSGEVYPEWLTITAVKGSAGELINYVGTLTDITSRKAAEEEIKHLAFYDPLTRLPNRRLLLGRAHQSLAASARSKREGALLFIDLDDFKTLNDTLGHDIGDLLLEQVAQRLSACVREGDTVARLGGDEFVVMLESLSKNPQKAAAQSEVVAEKILAALNEPYPLAGHLCHSTPSIGIALFGTQCLTVNELLKRADLAMYQAKAAGRNTLRFFAPAMS